MSQELLLLNMSGEWLSAVIVQCVLVHFLVLVSKTVCPASVRVD